MLSFNICTTTTKFGIPLDPTDHVWLACGRQVLPMVASNAPGTRLDGEIHRNHLGDPDLLGGSL